MTENKNGEKIGNLKLVYQKYYLGTPIVKWDVELKKQLEEIVKELVKELDIDVINPYYCNYHEEKFMVVDSSYHFGDPSYLQPMCGVYLSPVSVRHASYRINRIPDTYSLEIEGDEITRIIITPRSQSCKFSPRIFPITIHTETKDLP